MDKMTLENYVPANPELAHCKASRSKFYEIWDEAFIIIIYSQETWLHHVLSVRNFESSQPIQL